MSETTKFSVLMSVYHKEDPKALKEALDSVYNQTIKPSQVVMVKDGPLTEELDAVIDKYDNTFEKITIVPLATNKGLGLALAEGLTYCEYPLVARADTDDINVIKRFELQLQAFDANPELSIVGGQIDEFYIKNGEMVFTGSRRVPTVENEIRKFSKRRNPFNHMTVMFKKRDIEEVGSYRHKLGHEDYDLWMRVLASDKRVFNLSKTLVYVRAGIDLMSRRGGKEYAKNFLEVRKEFYQAGYISFTDYLGAQVSAIVLWLFPSKFRASLYQKVLRKKETN